MKYTEGIMAFIHTENNHARINAIEIIQITTETTSPKLLNDSFSGKNIPLFIPFTSVVRLKTTDKWYSKFSELMLPSVKSWPKESRHFINISLLCIDLRVS